MKTRVSSNTLNRLLTERIGNVFRKKADFREGRNNAQSYGL